VEVDQLNVRNVDLNHLENDWYDILGSMTTSFTMKMRGVPFEAGEKEIYDV
jgi:hypothetical protein